MEIKVKKTIEFTEEAVKSIIAKFLEDNGYPGVKGYDVQFKLGTREQEVFEGFLATKREVPCLNACIVTLD